MAKPFGEGERWVAPNGKHALSPESVSEGLQKELGAQALSEGSIERSMLNVWPRRKREIDEMKVVSVNTCWKDSQMSLCKLFYSKHTSKRVGFKVGSDQS